MVRFKSRQTIVNLPRRCRTGGEDSTRWFLRSRFRNARSYSSGVKDAIFDENLYAVYFEEDARIFLYTHGINAYCKASICLDDKVDSMSASLVLLHAGYGYENTLRYLADISLSISKATLVCYTQLTGLSRLGRRVTLGVM
jgi:hypothetical protein